MCHHFWHTYTNRILRFTATLQSLFFSANTPFCFAADSIQPFSSSSSKTWAREWCSNVVNKWSWTWRGVVLADEEDWVSLGWCGSVAVRRARRVDILQARRISLSTALPWNRLKQPTIQRVWHMSCILTKIMVTSRLEIIVLSNVYLEVHAVRFDMILLQSFMEEWATVLVENKQ